MDLKKASLAPFSKTFTEPAWIRASSKGITTVRFFIIDSEILENVLKATFEKMSCELRHENLRAKFENQV